MSQFEARGSVRKAQSEACTSQETVCRTEDGARLSFVLSPVDGGNSVLQDTPAPTAPVLVVVNGLANNESQWLRYFEAWREEGHAFLYWDYRGHGRSPRPPDPTAITVPSQASDLEHVMRSTLTSGPAGAKPRVVLVAYSLGTQVALEYCTTRMQDADSPVQVEGVISILGTYGNVVDALFGRGSILTWLLVSLLAVIPGWLLHLLSLLPAALPRVTYWMMVATGLGESTVSYATAVRWAQHLTVMDADSARGFLLAAQQHSLSNEKLQRVGVPVLVISGGQDKFSPPLHTDRLLRHLPDTRHEHLSTASHMGLAGHSAAILSQIRTFLGELSCTSRSACGGGHQ
mmetsp:Transcript_30042/g.84785  ORF Transcript_30042/g.84785 Transcript_30042/m.84785 type:complete len:345 (-) Transcript_30042:166-1200(-)